MKTKKKKLQKKKKPKELRPGDVVVFEPKNFNPNFWDNLSEEDRLRYYGALGYGQEKPVFFVVLTHIRQAPGHCVLVSLQDQHIETMRHPENFRVVTDDEF